MCNDLKYQHFHFKRCGCGAVPVIFFNLLLKFSRIVYESASTHVKALFMYIIKRRLSNPTLNGFSYITDSQVHFIFQRMEMSLTPSHAYIFVMFDTQSYSR